MQEEIWKPVVGYEGLYEVSNFGAIRRLWNVSRVTKLRKLATAKGYNRVTLSKNGKPQIFFVHRLVAVAFIPNPHNYPQINHINEVKSDNRVENLEWCTSKYNMNYGKRTEKMVDTQLNRRDLSRSICQYDKDDNLIAIYPSTREAERQTGISRSSIRESANNVRKKYYSKDGTPHLCSPRKFAGGYKWKFIDDYETKNN